MMEVLEYDDPERYRAFVEPLLVSSEAENCLLLGVTGTLIDRPEIYEEFHLWAVSEWGIPVGAAAMTPPHNLLLAHSRSEEWLTSLAHFITRQGVDLPGVQGNEPSVDRFCSAWREVQPVEAELEVEMGVHALTEVSRLPPVSGEARRATDDDFALLMDWTSAFLEEADPESPHSSLEPTVRSRLGTDPSRGGLWLWEASDEPVSLSGYGGRTPNGIRIGPVYTPPEHRGHGYATALVAQQTRWLLEQGRSLCFLFTDMSNPTSNSIYRRIGYRRVANAKRYGFRTNPSDG